jgi:UDP-3-O-[3-hydroxymyristoyl] N-acetylglucosamine deacetylase
MPRDPVSMPASLLSPVQKTFARSVSCAGLGAHGGESVNLTLHPAPADTGIIFERTDLQGPAAIIPALWDKVQITPLCTRIVNAHGTEIRTIEHLIAALYASGIDNARITLDAGEVPLMDGASGFFMGLIAEAGVASCNAPRRFLKIIKPVEVRQGEAFARIEPASTPVFHITVAYPQHKIGPQSHVFDFEDQDFTEELATARTFGFESDIEALRRKGLTLGCSLDNAILIGSTGQIVNPEGYRFENELARHKLLDAIGDMALAGSVILGRFTGNRSGHAMNNDLLRALFADKATFVEVQSTPATSAKSPRAAAENEATFAG